LVEVDGGGDGLEGAGLWEEEIEVDDVREGVVEEAEPFRWWGSRCIADGDGLLDDALGDEAWLPDLSLPEELAAGLGRALAETELLFATAGTWRALLELLLLSVRGRLPTLFTEDEEPEASVRA
jgi:hypothetical protein